MRAVLVLLGLIFPMAVLTQNLVKNASFEEHLNCPNSLGTFNAHVKYWSTPTDGSTDYFNTCSKVMGAPENFNGVQYPKFGEAYAGVYFYAPGDYREYIQVQLKRTLQEDKKYRLEFYVSLAEGSDFAVKDFGSILSYQPIEAATKKELSKGRLYRQKGNRFQILEVGHSDFHEDKSVWLKIGIEFRAKGYEKYLTLGNLRDNKSTRKVQTKRIETKKGAYYYIDMVSITAFSGDNEIAQTHDTDTVYEFENVHFEFDRFNLDENARQELALIHDQLLRNEKLVLEIHGHTDNQGGMVYNQALSEKRARTIADYFISLGISSNRIFWSGHGSGTPKIGNDTEEGRAKNRRAEFVLKLVE